jgi:hypothetical protein
LIDENIGVNGLIGAGLILLGMILSEIKFEKLQGLIKGATPKGAAIKGRV